MKGIGKGTLLTIAVVVLLVIGVGTALAAGGPGRTFGFGGGQQYGMHNGAAYGVMAGGVVMDAAAEYIGISETALMTERHDGKSLAEIATGHGKTVAGLETALVTAFKANLDKAVAAGRLTETQAAQALTNFKAQVSTIVERTATGSMNGRGGGMMGGGHCRWTS